MRIIIEDDNVEIKYKDKTIFCDKADELAENKEAVVGYENMSAREREMFNTLAEHLTKEKKINELKSIGVKADLLDSKEFKDFASKFNSNTSVKDIYELYSRLHKILIKQKLIIQMMRFLN